MQWMAYAAEETSVIDDPSLRFDQRGSESRASLHCVVDAEKCVLCSSCLKLGCPAITKQEGRIVTTPSPATVFFVRAGLPENRLFRGKVSFMNKNGKNVLLVGVGGQGTILASKLLSEGLLHSGMT